MARRRSVVNSIDNGVYADLNRVDCSQAFGTAASGRH